MLKTIQERIASITLPLRIITAQEAASECAGNDGVLIDVREPGESQNQPSESAINFPRGVLEMKMAEKFPDAGKPVYLHCASGVRAKLAAEQLALMGYENVSVITCPVIDICKHFPE